MIKLFLLGRPGSGKSTIARLIEMLASDSDLSTYYIDDYSLLQNMFLIEESQHIPDEQRKFIATGPEKCKAFDVVKFSVLNEVLEEMKKKILQVDSNWASEKKLYLLEFARNNYREALSLFGTEFLIGSYFVYLDVDLEICIQRINLRVPCNNFVSENIMRHFYFQDDWEPLCTDLKYVLNSEMQVRTIKNNSTLEQLENVVSLLVEDINSVVLKEYEAEELEELVEVGT